MWSRTAGLPIFSPILTERGVQPPMPSTTQSATIFLRTKPTVDVWPYAAFVTRITPTSIRMQLVGQTPCDPAELFSMNRDVDVILDMPSPRPPATSRSRLSGIAVTYTPEGARSILLDLDFIDLTAEEETVLRESNPGLVVA